MVNAAMLQLSPTAPGGEDFAEGVTQTSLGAARFGLEASGAQEPWCVGVEGFLEIFCRLPGV